MKKPLIVAMLMLAMTMAHADGWRGGDGGGWRGGGEGGWQGGDGGGIGLGSALIGGVIGGLVANQGPAYVQPMPAPVYAAPYPAYGGYVQTPYYPAPAYGGYGYGGGDDDEGDD